MNQKVPSSNKHLQIFAFGFLIFAFLPTILANIGFFDLIDSLLLFNVRYYTHSDYLSITVYFICICILMMLIGREYYDKLVKSLTKNENIIKGIAIGVLIITITILYNLILSQFIKTTENVNETSVESLTTRQPVLAFMVVVIIAPVFEEYLYRFGLFGFFKQINRPLAYVFTMLIFALIHFNVSSDPQVMINELLNLPTYLIAGLLLSFAYDKYGIGCSIYAHMFNNLIAFISTFLAV